MFQYTCPSMCVFAAISRCHGDILVGKAHPCLSVYVRCTVPLWRPHNGFCCICVAPLLGTTVYDVLILWHFLPDLEFTTVSFATSAECYRKFSITFLHLQQWRCNLYQIYTTSGCGSQCMAGNAKTKVVRAKRGHGVCFLNSRARRRGCVFTRVDFN